MMTASLRASLEHDKRILPSLVLVVMILSLPNLVPTFWPTFNHYQAEAFWMGMGLILMPCVFAVPVRICLYLWLPASAFIPAAVMYSLNTGSPFREWALVVLMETSWQELGRFWTGAVTAMVLAPFTVWFLWRFISRHIPAGHRLGWPARVCILLFATITPLGYLAQTGWELGTLVVQRKLSSIFPSGLGVSAWSAFRIRNQLEDRSTAAAGLQVKSNSPAPREIYVLVIGESARYASMQINGAARLTTPLLAATSGLLSFQNVTAPATVTLMSVPVLLTPSNAETLRSAPARPSVLGVFKRAGFHTAWFSTQMKHGMYDTSCSLFSNDADESLFLSGNFAPGEGTYISAFDGELLKPVRELLARNEAKTFIVLHTMGSHQHYCDRFPPEFNQFPCEPSHFQGNLITGKYSEEEKRNFTNAYDNTILYTDWLLSQLIGTLAETHAVSALYYISDHGQNGANSPLVPFAHGSATRDVIHVPVIAWLSAEFRSWRGAQTEAMESHVATPFSADTTFHTLVDLAGLDCSLLNRSQSAASRDFNPGRRLVRTLDGAVLDYDAAFRTGHAPMK